MPLSFMRETVTIERAPIETRNGMEYRNWTKATASTVGNVQITAQATSREFDGRTEQLVDRRTLRAPYAADIKPGDKVTYKGNDYEVDGEVFHTESPTGRVSSTRCALIRWRG